METIVVPAQRVDDAINALEKVNRRAQKNGLPVIEYSISETFMVEEPRIRDIYNIWYDPTDIVERPYCEIVFDPTVIVVAGYEPIATLSYEHERPTIFEWPGKTIPDHMKDVHGECAHCGLSRQRKNVFILRNVDNGEYTNVGSSCVKDFLGYDPKLILSMHQYLRNAVESIDDDPDRATGVREIYFVDLQTMLPIAVAIVESCGWTSRSRAGQIGPAGGMINHVTPTADLVSEWMFQKHREYLPEQLKSLDMSPSARNKYIQTANRVREMVQGINPTNTYEHNLQIIAEDGYCTVREFGLAVSMVAYAMRSWEKESEKKEIVQYGGHVGEIGERLDLDVTVRTVKPIDSHWGVSFLVKMLTNDNEWLTWFASRDPGVDEGDIISVRGTVKAHKEWQGRSETQLTRCKIKEI